MNALTHSKILEGSGVLNIISAVNLKKILGGYNLSLFFNDFFNYKVKYILKLR